MSNDFTYTAPDPLAIDFNPPIKNGTGELPRLSVGEPTVSQVRSAEQFLLPRNGSRGPRLYQRALIAKMTNVPEDVISEVPSGMFSKVAKYAQTFVNAGLEVPEDSYGERVGNFTTLTINFDPPMTFDGVMYPSVVAREPTLGQMATADSALGDMSVTRVRMFQENLVAMSTGLSAHVVGLLPISVLNRLATFASGFSTADQTT